MTTATNPFEVETASLPIDTVSQETIPATSEVADVPVYDAVTYDASDYDATGYGSTNYDATVKDLTGDQLVTDNLDKVLDKGGVLMDVARSAGDEYANSRGMLNSSMGAEASMRSMIDSALPIAQQDASSQLSQLQTNQQFENTASQYNATADNEASRFNATADNEASRFNADAQNVAGQFNSASQNDAAQFNTTNEVQQLRDSILQSYQLQMENLSTNNKALLIDLEQRYSAAIQSDKNASDTYVQTIDSIAQIMSTKDLSVDQQNAAMNELVSMLDAYLDFNLNLTSVDSISGISTSTTTDTTAADNTTRIDQADASAAEYREEARVKIAEYDQKLGALGPKPVQLVNGKIGDLGTMYNLARLIKAWEAKKVTLDSEYSSWLRYAENNPGVWQ